MADAVSRAHSLAERRKQEQLEREKRRERQERQARERQQPPSRPRFDDEAPPQAKGPPKQPKYDPLSSAPPPRQQQPERERPTVSLTSDVDVPQREWREPAPQPVEEREERKKDKKPSEPEPFQFRPLDVGLTTDRPDTGPVGLGATGTMGGITPTVEGMIQSPTFTEGPATREEARLRGWREPTTETQRITQLRQPGPQPQPLGFLAQAPVQAAQRLAPMWGQAGDWLNRETQVAVEGTLQGRNLYAPFDPNTPGQQYYETLKQQQDLENEPGFQVGDLWRGVVRGAEWLGNVGTEALMNPRRATSGSGAEGTFSLGQAAAAYGTSLNRSFNPLSPNYVNPLADKDGRLSLGFSPAQTQVARHHPMGALLSLGSVTLGQIGDFYKDEMQKFSQINKRVDQWTPEERERYGAALTNQLWGGADKTAQTISLLENKERVAAWYEMQASQAQSRGDALAAATFGAQANKWRTWSDLDIIDGKRNPLAMIVGGSLFDLTNLLPIGMIGEGIQNVRRAKIFDITAEQAIKNYGDAIKVAEKITGQPGRTWWQAVNPFARTADTVAHQTADVLWTASTQLLKDVTTREDALLLLRTWAQNPQQLINGVTGLVSPGIRAVSEDGLYRVGAGAIGNKYVADAWRMVRQVADQLPNLKSLQPDVPFNPLQLLGELDELFYSASRATEQARAAINPTTIQRAILSDMWLNLRPGHWIRNALAATATEMADGIYTWKNTDEIMGFWSSKLGGAEPTRRISEAIGGAVSAAEGAVDTNWTRRFWPKYNPYASLAEAGSKIWSGLTSIGQLPLGEQKFYLNGFDVAGERAFIGAWKNVVNGQWGAALEAMGVPPQMVNRFVNEVIETGIGGSKQDVIQNLRRMLAQPNLTFNLRDLQLSDELISLAGRKQINELLRDLTPTNLEEVTNRIRTVFDDEVLRRAQILNIDPPQPGVYEWTKVVDVEDGADVVDTMIDAGRRAGQDVSTQARQTVNTYLDAMNNSWEAFRLDVASTDNPQALNVAFDLWAQVYDMKRAARAAVDDLGKTAATQGGPDAWNRKWQETQRIYEELTKQLDDVFVNGREALAAVGRGEQVSPRFDWNTIIDRYLAYDEMAVSTARAATPGAVGDPRYVEVINANRQFLDKSFAEVFEAFRRNPSQESLDLLANASRQIDRWGAQVAAYLKPFREAALAGGNNSKLWDDFFSRRNKAWAQYFDNAVLHNNATTRLITLMGVGAETATRLTWADEFAGGTFRLVGQNPDGAYRAVRIEDGTLHTFAGQKLSKGAVATQPQVPQTVLDDWNMITGKTEEVVDEVVADIQNATIRLVEPRQVEQGALGVWRQASGDQPVTIIRSTGENAFGDRTYLVQLQDGTTLDAPMGELFVADQGTRRLRALTDADIMRQAQETIQAAPTELEAIEEARRSMRAEWDRNAKAATGVGKLDTFVAKYYRDGVVNIPENAKGIEDLYGITVAGRRIDGQADLEAFVQEYANLKRQADRIKSGAGAAGEEYKAAFARGEEYADWDRLRKFRVENQYTVAEGLDDLNFTGAQPGTNLYEQMRGDLAQSIANDGVKAPTVGDMAADTVELLGKELDKILTRLPELAQGLPNQLTPRQRQEALDRLVSLLPKYDDAVAYAVRAGQEAADFAMLNFQDRRNIDTFLSHVFPYHFFWTRSAKNWALRSAARPRIWNFFYDTQNAIEKENLQSGTADVARLRGTVPNPLAPMGIGPDRLANPLTWALPYATYLPTREDFEQDAPTQVEKWLNKLQQWTPGIMPAYNVALNFMLDQSNPLPGGKSRLQDQQLGDYVPLYRIAGYAYQAATGATPPQGFFSWADEWEQGRIGRQAAVESAEGRTDVRTAQFAQDVAGQHQYGWERLPEQLPGAIGVYEDATRQSGEDRLWATGLSWLLGVPGYNYPQGEQDLRTAAQERRGLGFDPTANPYGSQAAVTEFDERTGQMVDPWFSYGQLYPGTESRPPAPPTYPYRQTIEETRPGVRAVDDMKKEEKARLDGEIDEQMRQFVDANPNAKISEVNAERRRLEDERDATLAEMFPSASEFEPPGEPILSQRGADPTTTIQQGGGDFYGNYSPQELADKAREQAVWAANREMGERPERPGPDATQAEWDAYNAAQDAYNVRFEQKVEEYLNDPAALSALVYGRPVDLAQATPITPAEGKTETQTLIDDTFNARRTDEERTFTTEKLAEAEAMDGHWEQYLALTNAKNWTAAKQYMLDNPDFAEYYQSGGRDAWWLGPGSKKSQEFLAAQNRVAELGEEDQALWTSYFALEKGDREEFRTANPRIRVLLLAGYNPDEYAAATELFGADAWDLWANVPAYADTDEARAARSAYYDANPQAKLLNAWLRGRPANYDAESDGEDWQWNFGADYEEARELFGENIWDIFGNYRTGWDKAQKRSYFDANPQLSDFFAWWYGDSEGTGVRAAARRSGPGYDSLGNRAYGSWGGGGGYNPNARAAYINMPEVRPERMGAYLWEAPVRREWRPYYRRQEIQNPAPPERILRQWR